MTALHAFRLFLALSAVCLVGCGPATAPPQPKAVLDQADDHDHGHDHSAHHHPETLAAGTAELESLVAEIAGKMESGATDAADDAVHGLGHLLDDVQGLLKKSSLSEEALGAATKAVDELYECFDELDTAIHAAPGKFDPPAQVHARLKERIDAAVKALKEAGR
jgi:hypothetical protein